MKEFPSWILFKSVSSEVEFVEEITDKKLKDRIANYKFIVSNNNLGKIFPLGIKQLENLYSADLIKITK